MSELSGRFLPPALLGAVILAVAAPAGASQTQDADTADLVVGTWILNLDKSTFDPGPPPKSQTRTYERHKDGVRATISTVTPDDRSISSEYVAGYDSLEYPFTGSPNVDTISLRRVNAYIAEATLKHARNIIGTAERVISRDGKLMTINYKGADQQGRQVEVKAVYDKKPGT